MVLLVISGSLVAAASVLWLFRSGAEKRWGATYALLIDAIWIVGLVGALSLVLLSGELTWFAATDHLLVQSVKLISSGHADAARAVYLDDAISTFAQHRTQQLIEALELLFFGGVLGFRLSTLWSGYRYGTPTP